MKILSFKNTSVQEKNNVNINSTKVEPVQKSTDSTSVLQEIHIKNFSAAAAKLNVEEDLDLITIEKLRNELKSGSFTTEKLADAMMDYVEKNSWHKRL